MNLLLDTHAFLFLSQDSKLLGMQAQAELREGSNAVFISICSAWEMAIKLKLGKLELDLSLKDAIDAGLEAGLRLLELSPDAVYRTLDLDLTHRDPFDRILAAQALTAGMALVSRDPAFDAWGVQRIW